MTVQPSHDLFGHPSAAAGTVSGSVRRSAQGRDGGGAGSAAVPFLTLPRLRGATCNAVTQTAPQALAAPPAPPPLQETPLTLSSSKGAAAGPFVPVKAMEDVLALRMRQIHDHGHSLDADRALIAQSGQRHAVAKLAQQALHDAIEDMMFNKDAAQIRRRLVKAAALVLAAIDAEDARDGI